MLFFFEMEEQRGGRDAQSFPNVEALPTPKAEQP
jgi:hypothetical protein